MVGHSTGATQALCWYRFIRTCFAASLLMGIGASCAPAAVAKAPITMALPSIATISLLSGRTISGVRLTALGPSEVTYEKGGKRHLPMLDVKSISFSGPLTLESKNSPILSTLSLRREFPKPLFDFINQINRSIRCQLSRQIRIPSSALLVQPTGEALSLDPASMESSVVTDLQQAISSNILVVETLRLDPDGRMRLEYKSCLPIGKSLRQW